MEAHDVDAAEFMHLMTVGGSSAVMSGIKAGPAGRGKLSITGVRSPPDHNITASEQEANSGMACRARRKRRSSPGGGGRSGPQQWRG